MLLKKADTPGANTPICLAGVLFNLTPTVAELNFPLVQIKTYVLGGIQCTWCTDLLFEGMHQGKIELIT